MRSGSGVDAYVCKRTGHDRKNNAAAIRRGQDRRNVSVGVCPMVVCHSPRRRPMTMKPTISNAFNDGSSSESSNVKPPTTGGLERRMSGFPEDTNSNKSAKPNPRKSLAASLSAMQVDLRETNFGWSLDLSPIQAVDALNAVKFNNDAAPARSEERRVGKECRSRW